jgi:hypothetical protein
VSALKPINRLSDQPDIISVAYMFLYLYLYIYVICIYLYNLYFYLIILDQKYIKRNILNISNYK